ncbi:MarR family transcriptional regulator [Janibacter sp. YIM B02568]|nr:MarR family transcriptional regulator [Janibacter endophyticus]
MYAGAVLSFDPIDAARTQWVERGWGDSAEGMAAVTSVIRAQAILMRRVETALRDSGLTFARYEVLMLLSFTRHEALPMRAISSRLQVHQSSVTNAVDRLESAGLVTRAPSPDDRRTVLVGLTSQGIQVAKECTRRLNDEVFGALGLSDEDTRQLVAILARLRADAGDFSTP